MDRLRAIASRHGISALLLALTLVYASGIPSIRSLFAEGFVSTKFLPQVLVIFALTAIVAIVWRDERAARDAGQDEDRENFDMVSAGKPILLFFAILGYVALFRPIGFIISTIALSLCCLWLFDFASDAPSASRRHGLRLLVATVIAALAYLLFAVAFAARLPLFPGDV